ncbi:hypothetical protein [Stutzerimonas azotifigens]|uniref:Uncharacterized protein n=1 Tax=Stutzerimonas azotifigens TaxID=291995 RepID=A0ABR5Z397_9GAMM|nr:hypothetical protein [Stutzerimonas azotifigens]MBA1274622.1 hypothetical protein [Stutzerimonas azotifigens]
MTRRFESTAPRQQAPPLFGLSDWRGGLLNTITSPRAISAMPSSIGKPM